MSQQNFEPGSNYVVSQPQPTEVPMTQPQPTLMPMAQPQPGQVILTTSPVNMQPTKSNHQKTLRHLGISEVVLGGLIVLIGVVLAGSRSDFFYGSFTTGEGIWCGIWIIVSGSLGIVLGKPNPTRCLINTRMAFGIVGSVFAAIGFSMSTLGAVNTGPYGFRVGLFSCMTVTFFASMVLMIVSSGFCCAISGCCCHPYYPTFVPGSFPGQVIYTHQQATYPVTQSVYPGYAPQGYQPMQQTQSIYPSQLMQQIHLSQQMQPMHPSQQMQTMQPMQPISSVISQSGVVQSSSSMLSPNFQASSASQQKQQEAFSGGQPGNISGDQPPTYKQFQ